MLGKMAIRVCIIGAGPSGMNALGYFKTLKDKGEPCEVTVYEKQGAPGGLWNFTWRTGDIIILKHSKMLFFQVLTRV